MNLQGRNWTALDARERLPELQRLFERNPDFFVQEFGRPPRPDEASHALAELPPGKLADDKLFLLLVRGDEVFGHLEVLRDFRRAREAYIGNFLLDGLERGRGTGREIVAALEAALDAQGFDSVRLCATEQNEDGRRFWARLGYRVDKVFPPRLVGAKETVLHEFVKGLAAGGSP